MLILSTSLINVKQGLACPICEKEDWCRISSRGGYVHCMRVVSDRAASSGGFIHFLNSENNGEKILVRSESIKKDNSGCQIANDETLDQIYRLLIKSHKLSDAHRADLLKRGVPEEKLEMYGTLHRGLRNSKDWYGPSPEGVPGFFQERDEWFFSTPFQGSAILVPTVTEKGLIVGIQFRTDHKDKNKRYMWSSSGKLNNGVRAGIRVHVSFAKEKKDNRTWLTEGHFKAERISELLGADALSIPGVSNTEVLVNTILKMGCTHVVMAFDMDKKRNDQVAHHAKKLKERLIERNIGVSEAEWCSRWNGIDDALDAGEAISEKKIFSPRKNESFIHVDAGHQLVSDKLVDVLNSNRAQICVVNATTGVGKTTAALSAMLYNSLDNDKFMWLSDTHQLLNETRAAAGNVGEVLKGRSAEKSSPFYCERKDACERAGNAGHNIMESVCKRCPLFQEKRCAYLNHVQQVLQEKIIFAPKAAALNAGSRLDHAKTIVIDEALTPYLMKLTTVTKDELNYTLANINQNHKNAGEFRKIVMYLLGCMSATKLGEYSFETAIHPDSEFTEADVPDSKLTEDKPSGTVYHKNWLPALIGGVIKVTPGRLEIMKPNYPIIEKLRSKKLIILDATPIIPILRLLDNEIESKIFTVNVVENMVVTQVTNVNGSKKQTVHNKIYSEKYAKAIDAIALPGRKTAVFSTKANITELRKRFLNCSHIEFGYYGNDTKGTNRYIESDTIVVASDYIPNLSHMEHVNKTLSLYGIDVSISDLIDAYAQAEIKQAIGRGRATRRDSNNPIEVFILTKREIKGIHISKLVTLQELCGEVDGRVSRQKKLHRESLRAARGLLIGFMKTKHIEDVNISEAAEHTGIDRRLLSEVRDEILVEKYQRLGLNRNYILAEFRAGVDLRHFEWIHRRKKNPVQVNGTKEQFFDTGDTLIFTEEEIDFLQRYIPNDIDSQEWNAFVDATSNIGSVSMAQQISHLESKTFSNYLGVARRIIDNVRSAIAGLGNLVNGENNVPDFLVIWLEQVMDCPNFDIACRKRRINQSILYQEAMNCAKNRWYYDDYEAGQISEALRVLHGDWLNLNGDK